MGREYIAGWSTLLTKANSTSEKSVDARVRTAVERSETVSACTIAVPASFKVIRTNLVQSRNGAAEGHLLRKTCAGAVDIVLSTRC